MNNAIEDLNKAFKELKAQISTLRKKGADMLIADLRMMNIPSKIKMAQVTKSDKDIAKVKYLLSKAKEEIDSVKMQFPDITEQGPANKEEDTREGTEHKEENVIERTEEGSGEDGEHKEGISPIISSRNIDGASPAAHRIYELIDATNNHIAANDKKQAILYYNRIIKAFKRLEKQQKVKLLKPCLELRNKLM